MLIAEAELHSFVAELRKGIEYFCKKANGLPLSEDVMVICEPQMEAIKMLTSDDMDFFVCTGWCRFPLRGCRLLVGIGENQFGLAQVIYLPRKYDTSDGYKRR